MACDVGATLNLGLQRSTAAWQRKGGTCQRDQVLVESAMEQGRGAIAARASTEGASGRCWTNLGSMVVTWAREIGAGMV